MWTYIQFTGALIHYGMIFGYGYSGKGEGKNNPAMQHIHNVGPIPVGTYIIQPPHDSETHGPFVLPLLPNATNEMFGRSGFLIHGDSIKNPGTASEGCIILPRAVRNTIFKSEDVDLKVFAEYKDAYPNI